MNFKKYLEETTEKHSVLAFGRMNPPTTGHAKLVDKVKDVAKEVGGTHHIVISHSQDPKKNPLSADQKIKHAQRYPRVISKNSRRVFLPTYPTNMLKNSIMMFVKA